MSDKRKNRLFKINGVESDRYAQLVDKYVREKYSQSAVEAIINNYLSNPNNVQYKSEFTALQAYREQCKSKARTELEMFNL